MGSGKFEKVDYVMNLPVLITFQPPPPNIFPRVIICTN